MTANTLSIEQRCEVARAVTQQPWKYLHGHVILDGDKELHYWYPDFEAEDWMRSEVLALVEYLHTNIEAVDDHGWQMLLAVHQEVRNKDVAALEQLAHQMITKGKEDG